MKISKEQLRKELKVCKISLNSDTEYVRWVLRSGETTFDKVDEFRVFYASHWGHPPPPLDEWYRVVPCFDA